MRNRFDQLGKDLGLRALTPLGWRDRTTAQQALNTETMYADLRHEPDPAFAEERTELGLLGRLASQDCLIELHSEPPGPEELRSCLAKHLSYWQQRIRDARAGGGRSEPPRLWILSAGVPRRILAELAFDRAPAWPAGVYTCGGETLRIGLVVASELPVDRSTLLVRLMAGGPLVARAVPEVVALGASDPLRLLAEPILLQFAHVAGAPQPDSGELEESLMKLYKTFDELRDDGGTEGRRHTLRRQLTLKFGKLSPEIDAQIERASTEELDGCLERILFADSLAAVLAS
ncbi:MAG: hypothetical protein KF773_08230 [Deltaproteobacteria bacterium]|nr:hypothetical protein [Deltaproteobacteria bacterium]